MKSSAELRTRAAEIDTGVDDSLGYAAKTINFAADALDAVTAERDQFERERGEYRNSFHDKIIECSKAEARIRRLDQVISGFYKAIKHGDDAHKEWLLEKINSYMAAVLSDTEEVP